ncbi:MAG: hypothetical protein HFJ54_03915 [Clostridia bacterium]|nr:hypothetical protein [Clostridia bacterium]
MRKILIILLIVLLFAGLGLMVIQGISIGNFEISDVRGIIEENEGLDEKIAELENLKKEDYEVAKASLNTSYKGLQNSKEKYQDAITYSTEDEIRAASQTEKYKINFLWTKIGFYATKYDVTMQANVSSGSIPGHYNISFTALGEYISISEFIHSIEDDSKLGFRIEDFTLEKYSDEKLQATFVIRNVAIDENSLNDAKVTSSTTQTTTQTNDETNTVVNKVDHSNDINNLRALNEEVHGGNTNNI